MKCNVDVREVLHAQRRVVGLSHHVSRDRSRAASAAFDGWPTSHTRQSCTGTQISKMGESYYHSFRAPSSFFFLGRGRGGRGCLFRHSFRHEKDTERKHHAIDRRERPGNTNRRHFPEESTSGASNAFGRQGGLGNFSSTLVVMKIFPTSAKSQTCGTQVTLEYPVDNWMNTRPRARRLNVTGSTRRKISAHDERTDDHEELQ